MPQQCVIAGMIVIVGDRGVEHHSAKELCTVSLWLTRPASHTISQQWIRPFLATQVIILGIEHRERTYKTQTEVGARSTLAVKPLHHQYVTISNRFQSRRARIQTTFASEVEGRELYALQIDPVGSLGKFRQPKRTVMLDGSLGSR